MAQVAHPLLLEYFRGRHKTDLSALGGEGEAVLANAELSELDLPQAREVDIEEHIVALVAIQVEPMCVGVISNVLW